MKVYAPANEQKAINRKMDELNDIERFVVETFRDDEFMVKFRQYMSVEEKKGEEGFDAIAFGLFYVSFITSLIIFVGKSIDIFCGFLKFYRLLNELIM